MKIALAILLILQMASLPPQPAGAAGKGQPQGSFGVRNEKFGLFLRPRDASSRDGEPIVLYAFQPWKCMAWHLQNGPDGTRLVNFFTAKSFQVDRTSTRKPLVQAPPVEQRRRDQAFHFIPLSQGTFEISSGVDGALTAMSDEQGTVRVFAMPWKDLPEQRWKLVDIPDHFTM